MESMPPTSLVIPDEKRAESRRGRLARNWIWFVGALLILAVISSLTLHRGYIEDDKRTATRLVEQFHRRMNAGQFDQIYDDYDESLKNAKPREDEVHSLQGVSSHFGAFRAVSDSEMNVIVGSVVEVRAAYNCTFEKGDATELFGFLRRGHELRLAFYQVSPGTAKLEWKHRSEPQK